MNQQVNELNLVYALRMGMIDWFKFFEEWRKL